MKKQTLILAQKSLIFYQRSFYGWNARYDKEAKKIYDQYTAAIQEIKEELDKLSPKKKKP